jgi:hypothetical protein
MTVIFVVVENEKKNDTISPRLIVSACMEVHLLSVLAGDAPQWIVIEPKNGLNSRPRVPRPRGLTYYLRVIRPLNHFQ